MPQTTSERHTYTPVSVQPPKGGDFLLHGIHFRHRELVKVTLKAKKNLKFNIEAVDGFIVDKHLNTVKF